MGQCQDETGKHRQESQIAVIIVLIIGDWKHLVNASLTQPDTMQPFMYVVLLTSDTEVSGTVLCFILFHLNFTTTQ